MKIFRHCIVLVWVVTGSTLLGACSEKPAPTNASTPTSPPPAARTMATNDATDGQTLTADVAAGGIPTTYVAHFDQDKLTRIDETRQSNRSGSYEFYGARLLKYAGDALDSDAPVLLEFSMTGSVEKSQSGGSAATPAQIDSIRSRGQLLRSHALAQRATRMHSPH
jgi:hypothetical protein